MSNQPDDIRDEPAPGPSEERPEPGGGQPDRGLVELLGDALKKLGGSFAVEGETILYAGLRVIPNGVVFAKGHAEAARCPEDVRAALSVVRAFVDCQLDEAIAATANDLAGVVAAAEGVTA